MYKLVVLSALLAVAAAHVIAPAAPLAYAHAAPVAQVGHVAYAHAAPVHYAHAAPVVATAPLVAPAVVKTYSAPAVAISHQITKQVHYESKPVVTGYTSQILKPDLGSIATPLETVSQQRVLAPARTVATITPQITEVHPEVHVRKVPVDVPVAHPYVSEVEVRQPVVAAPAVAVAPAVHAVPTAYSHSVVAAAPAVAAVHALPTAYSHSVYASAPAVHAAVPALGYAGIKHVY